MNANYKRQNIHYVNSVKFYYLFRFSGNRVSILVENPEIFLLEVGINKLQAFFSVSKHRLYFKVCKKECNFIVSDYIKKEIKYRLRNKSKLKSLIKKIMEVESNYYQNERLSHSDLTYYLENGIVMFSRYKEAAIQGIQLKKPTAAMLLGRATHAAILEPETMDDLYTHFPGEIPNSPNKKKFCQIFLEIGNAVEAYKESYTVTRDTPETVRKKSGELLVELSDYILHLKNLGSKILLESSDYKKIMELKVSFFENLAVQSLFNKFSKSKRVEESIYNSINNVLCKGKPDMILESEDGSLCMIDIKTTSNASPETFRKYLKWSNYERQLSFYTLLLDRKVDFYYIIALDTIGIYTVVYEIPVSNITAHFSFIKTRIAELQEAINSKVTTYDSIISVDPINEGFDLTNFYIVPDITS